MNMHEGSFRMTKPMTDARIVELQEICDSTSPSMRRAFAEALDALVETRAALENLRWHYHFGCNHRAGFLSCHYQECIKARRLLGEETQDG